MQITTKQGVSIYQDETSWRKRYVTDTRGLHNSGDPVSANLQPAGKRWAWYLFHLSPGCPLSTEPSTGQSLLDGRGYGNLAKTTAQRNVKTSGQQSFRNKWKMCSFLISLQSNLYHCQMVLTSCFDSLAIKIHKNSTIEIKELQQVPEAGDGDCHH